MEIGKVLAAAVVIIVILTVLRPQRPEFAVLVSLAAGIYLLYLAMGWVAPVLRLLEELSLRANVSLQYLNLILKIIGVAYLAEIGCQVARDAGEGAIASKIELAGKVIIIAMSVPVFTAVMQVILRLLA